MVLAQRLVQRQTESRQVLGKDLRLTSAAGGVARVVAGEIEAVLLIGLQ